MRRIPVLVLILFLTGCTHYVYTGTIAEKDAAGQDHTLLLYWNTTERALWFDEYAGGVRILPECSPATLVFEEKGNSIVWEVPAAGAPRDRAVCGAINNAIRIKDLGEGILLVTIYCNPASDDEFAVGREFNLKPRNHPYVFSIKRQKVKDIVTGTPGRPECRKETRSKLDSRL